MSEIKDRRRELRRRATDAEKILWREIRNNKLGVRFRRQHSIGGFIVDFYCSAKNLAVELKGMVHRGRTAKNYDEYRRSYLRELGVRVLEFWNMEVMEDVDGVVNAIILTLDPSPD